MSDITTRLRYRLDKGGPGTPCIIGYSDSGVTLEQDVQEATDEIERLRADLANMYRLRRECVAMADDLAADLAHLEDELRKVEGVLPVIFPRSTALARYRELKGQ